MRHIILTVLLLGVTPANAVDSAGVKVETKIDYQEERDRLVRLIAAYREHYYDVEFTAEVEELEYLQRRINRLQEELESLSPFIETLVSCDTTLLTN